MKALLTRLTPTVLVSFAVTTLAALAAFHVTLSLTEQGAVIAFVTAAAVVLLKYRTAESIIALIGAGLAVAVAFGIPVTSAQQESILTLVGLAVAVMVGKGAHTAVMARKATAAVLSGIHGHPVFKIGLVPTDPAKPILEVDRVLTGVTPPSSEDRYAGVTFGLDGNDQYGDCGPTSVDNNRRSTSKVATGTQRTAPLDAVYTLYKQSGNPNFPKEDNGVSMGGMLDALLKNGLAGDKPIAFGRLTDMSDQALERAVAVFGGVLFAVDLQTSQQAQSEGATPEWRYVKSGEWGGHAVYCGKYKVTPSGVDAPVISWDKEIGTDDSFRGKQLQEVWVIIWPWHLEHPAFLAGVDLTVLAAEYKALTGKELVLPTPAPPAPAPTPAGNANAVLWAAVKSWALSANHSAVTKQIAKALVTWAKASGLA